MTLKKPTEFSGWPNTSLGAHVWQELAIELFIIGDLYAVNRECFHVNLGPAEHWYAMPLQTVQIQISWLMKKPTDLDLHCVRMWIYINNLDLVIWLADNLNGCGILSYSAW